MKKGLFAVVLALILGLLASSPTWAMTGYELGVTDSSQYKEVVYLWGAPQVYSGTVKVSTKAKDNIIQTSLTYKLNGATKGNSLTRTVKLESQVSKNGNQEVYVTKMTGLSENIQVGNQKFKLKKDGGFFFSGTTVIDHRPIIDFTSENWYLKKTYELGRDGGTVTVESSGASEGYDSAWSKGTVTSITTSITGYGSNGGSPTWEGSVEAVHSDNYTRNLRYLPVQPLLISYEGGFLEESINEQSLKYSYDLPAVGADNEIDDNDRNRDSETMSMSTPPTQKRLFIKEFRDLQGHWAEQAIEAMCGLGVFPNEGNIFGPGVPALRRDLARGIAVMGELIEEEPVKKTNTRKTVAEEPLPFKDVSATDPDYKYIREVYRRGIINGSSTYIFGPNEQLTRAEATNALITALGLKRLAPNIQYTTPFYDDASIPLWAKDAVYVANKIGLVKGDGGYFRPNDVLSRAEFATLLDGLRSYLIRDFQRDYRDRIYTFK